jgi:hypothetical protein
MAAGDESREGRIEHTTAGHSKVRITTLIQSRHTLDGPNATGRQIREVAGIPDGFVLFRCAAGAPEPIPDDQLVEVRDGDHFFAQPATQEEIGH